MLEYSVARRPRLLLNSHFTNVPELHAKQTDFGLLTMNSLAKMFVQELVLQYKFHGWPVDEAGAPPSVTLGFRTWPDTNSVMLNVVYHGKQPTRLSEALWLTFEPPAATTNLTGMQLNKVDSWLSPFEVVRYHFLSLRVH